MKAERLQQIEGLFHAALEREESLRAEFLASGCAGDPDLFFEVESLLALERRANGFLEEWALDAVARTFDDDRPWQPEAALGGRTASDYHLCEEVREEGVETGCQQNGGLRFGPYTTVRMLGEGGMGIVYLSQQEHPVRRAVALKVVKPGMDSRQVIARFESERQALALMDHPNIARFFEPALGTAARRTSPWSTFPGFRC